MLMTKIRIVLMLKMVTELAILSSKTSKRCHKSLLCHQHPEIITFWIRSKTIPNLIFSNWNFYFSVSNFSIFWTIVILWSTCQALYLPYRHLFVVEQIELLKHSLPELANIIHFIAILWVDFLCDICHKLPSRL